MSRNAENQEALSNVEMRSLCTSEFAFIPDKVCIKYKGFRNKCLVKKKRPHPTSRKRKVETYRAMVVC